MHWFMKVAALLFIVERVQTQVCPTYKVQPWQCITNQYTGSLKLKWEYSSLCSATIDAIYWRYLGIDGTDSPGTTILVYDGTTNTTSIIDPDYAGILSYENGTRSATMVFSSVNSTRDEGVFEVDITANTINVPKDQATLTSVPDVTQEIKDNAALTINSEKFKLKDGPEDVNVAGGDELEGEIYSGSCVPAKSIRVEVASKLVVECQTETNCTFRLTGKDWEEGDELTVDIEFHASLVINDFGSLKLKLGTETTTEPPTEPPGGLSGGLIAAIVVPVVVVVVVVIVVAVLAAKRKLPHQKSKGKTATGGSQDASKLGSGAVRGNQSDGDVVSGATKGSQGPGDVGSGPPRDSEEARYSDESKRL